MIDARYLVILIKVIGRFTSIMQKTVVYVTFVF